MPPDTEFNPYTDDSVELTDDEKEFSAAFAESQQSDKPSDTVTSADDTTEAVNTEAVNTEVVNTETQEKSESEEPTSGDAAEQLDADQSDSGGSEDQTTDKELVPEGTSEVKESSDVEKDSKSTAPDYEKQISDLQAQIEQLKTQPSDAPATAEPQAEAKPLYNADEEEFLKKYAEDWSDVQRGEALTRRLEYQQLVKYIFDQVQEVYGPALDYTQSRSGRDQYTDLKALVPDYDDVRDKTLEWVDSQPDYLKSAYQEVIKSGTPEEVADMINRYKSESGHTTQKNAKPDSTPTTSFPEPEQKVQDPKKAAAAAALKVVKSTRGNTTSEPDPNDFSAAFKEFAAMK